MTGSTKGGYKIGPMDLQRVSRIAVAAAYQGGRRLCSFYGNLRHVQKKGATDLVTEADLASEQIIIETVQKAFPDHGIMAEESGTHSGDPDATWVIDPLDGTTNFAHGIGLFAVSIAFAHQGRPLVGVVLNPVSGELFTAVAGCGAYRNGKPISVSTTDTLADSLLVTGFPYNFAEMRPVLMGRFDRCLAASRGVRRFGAAALDLCFVACGQFDGFWEQNLKPWDTAAGSLIAAEAGARVTDFSQQPFRITHDCVLATNGRIHQEMHNLLTLEKQP